MEREIAGRKCSADKYLLTCFGGWIDATEDVEWCSSGPWYRAARDTASVLLVDSAYV